MMMIYPEHRKAAFGKLNLTEEDFFTDFGRRVFVWIRDAEANDTFQVSMMSESFSPEEVGRLTRMRVGRMQLTDNGETVFADTVLTLRRLLAERKASETGGSRERLQEILNKKRQNT